MKFINFAFLILAFIFVSCSQGPGKTNVKISLAAISGSEKFPGGLYLYGKNKSIPDMGFARKVNADDTLELELENGDWGFVVMGWDGSQYYEGNAFCDAMAKKLDGAEVSLSLEATRANCSPRYINGTNELYNGFYSLKIHTCAGIRDHIANGEPIPSNLKCDGSMDIFDGGMKSFKVYLAEYMPEKGESFSSESRCLATTSSTTPESVNLPLGSDQIQTAVVIKGYSDANCGTEVKGYVFRKGLRFPEDNFNAAAALDSTTKTVNLYAHAELCNEAQKAASPFAATSGGKNLICTPDQFANINNYPTENFILGADIDMSGLNTISSTFSGNFDGQNYRLYDGKHPIFQEVSASGSDIRIKNLVIDNFQISYNFEPSTNTLGILANQSYPSGGKLEITNLYFNSNNEIEISVPNDGTIGTNTYLGGLIGDVQVQSSGKLEVRDIKMNGLVRAYDDHIRVGGMFGRFKNTSGEKPKVESSRVGTSSEKMMIQGYEKIGGIAGQMQDAEVVQKTAVFAKLKGKDYVGGIVGDALHGTEIRDAKTEVEYLPLESINSRVGGIIGGIPGNDKSVSINGVLSSITVNDPGTTIKLDQLGGILGAYRDTSAGLTNSVRIHNSKAFMNSTIDGAYHGGIIGKVELDVSPASGGVEISNSVSMGRILVSEVADVNNSKRGGLVGYAKYINIKRSISDMKLVEGHSRAGGAIGIGEFDIITESQIEGSVKCHINGGPYCGGVVGESLSGTGKYSNLITNVDVKLVNKLGFSNTGLVAGYYYDDNSSLISNSIVMGSIEDSGSSLDYIYCRGAFGNCLDIEEFSSILSSDSGGCSPLTGPFDDTIDGPFCRLTFELQWEKYGKGILANPSLGYESGEGEYLAGNWGQPFEIHSAAEWNEIKDDAFLVQQTFKLMDDLDFISGLFEPIGSISNPFSGRIIPNGKTLKRINFTAGNDNAGIFNATGNGASIGWYNDPLKIFDMTIDCTSQLNCGVIGQAQDTNLFVVVKDGDVYGTGDNYGGLVGLGVERISINNSGYEGKVHGNSKVGGLVGFLSNGGSGGDHLIKNSFVRAKLIQADGGSSYSGGFVGLINLNNEELEIENSYLKFINTGIDNFKGDIAGLLMGGMNSGYKLKNVFANTKYLSLASGTTLYKGAWNLGSATDNGRSYTLVEPVARGYSVSSTAMDPNFPLVSREADLNTDMYRRDGGGSEWYQDVNGEVYLAWEKALGLK